MRLQQRIYQTATTDGARWAAYAHRPGDIFVCTSPKCGTTWMQTIVASLLWPDGNFPGPVMTIMPWFDGLHYNFDEIRARIAAQTHRRCIKTHTPADGIPIFDTARYIVVARAGRDVFMSTANHLAKLRADRREQINTLAAARGVDPMLEFHGDFHAFFDHWIVAASPMHYLATWWPLRDQANVLLVHYNDLKADLEHEMRRVAVFLDIEVPAARWPEVVHRCTFEQMRAAADKIGQFERLFEGGAQSFLFQGTNGRWQGILTDEELQRYRQQVDALLPPDAAHWFEHGWHNFNTRSSTNGLHQA